MEVMQDNAPSVGEALSLAMARAAELRDASPRRVRVRFLTRFGDLPDGLTIQATISPRTIPESEAQLGKGVRHIPFCELDARAGQLSQLVDDAAAEVEAAVAAAPCPAKRPSQIEEDLVTTAYDDLVESGYRSMLEVTGPLAAKSSASLSTAAIGEALVLLGAGGQDLQRHFAPQLPVPCAIDHAHAPLADALQDFQLGEIRGQFRRGRRRRATGRAGGRGFRFRNRGRGCRRQGQQATRAGGALSWKRGAAARAFANGGHGTNP